MSLSKITNFLQKTPVKNVASSSNVLCRNLGAAQPIPHKISEKKPDWNKAVNEAEKIVGYTTSVMSLRWLLSDEIANVAMHMRKLVGSNHPLLKAAKGLIFNGKENNMQAWGLVVLLISKAVGLSPNLIISDEDKESGFLHKQRALAEVTEMIRTSHLIHKGLMNLKITENMASEDGNGEMVFGNKIALLSGDYLLSNSCIELANLQDQELVELMSSAVRDLSESEFLGPRDSQNNPLPAPPKSFDETHFYSISNDPLQPFKIADALGNAEAEWTLRNLLESGSLLGKSCQGAVKLAGHSTELQESAYKFGRHLALAWQACLERQIFKNSASTSAPFSLISAPVLFTLQETPELYNEIKHGLTNIESVNYEMIKQNVLDGIGLEMTLKLQRNHMEIVYEFLEKLPSSDARGAIYNLLSTMDR